MFDCDCKDKTKSTYSGGGFGMSTLMYYPPVWDHQGNNLNPDMNTTTYNYTCNMCGVKAVKHVKGGNETWERIK